LPWSLKTGIFSCSDTAVKPQNCVELGIKRGKVTCLDGIILMLLDKREIKILKEGRSIFKYLNI